MDSSQIAARGRAIASLARGFAGAAEMTQDQLRIAEQVVHAILYAGAPGHTDHEAAVRDLQLPAGTPDPRD